MSFLRTDGIYTPPLGNFLDPLPDHCDLNTVQIKKLSHCARDASTTYYDITTTNLIIAKISMIFSCIFLQFLKVKLLYDLLCLSLIESLQWI